MGLDCVEIVLGWEKAFGIKITDEEVCSLTTPRKAMDLICSKLNATESASHPCLCMRAFHRLRNALCQAAVVCRSSVKPRSKVRALFPRDAAKEGWRVVQVNAGIADLPGLGWWPAMSARQTVGDFALWAVATSPSSLKPVAEPWTRAEIRRIVRAVVAETAGIADEAFSDDDDFVEDIGLD